MVQVFVERPHAPIICKNVTMCRFLRMTGENLRCRLERYPDFCRRTAQATVLRDMEAHRTANQSYMLGRPTPGIGPQRPRPVRESAPTEKRKLLNFVLSNCASKGGELTAKYRQPFDVLAVAFAANQQQAGLESAETARNDIWLPGMDSNHDSRLQRPLSYH